MKQWMPFCLKFFLIEILGNSDQISGVLNRLDAIISTITDINKSRKTLKRRDSVGIWLNRVAQSARDIKSFKGVQK